MEHKKRILLKLTGNILRSASEQELNSEKITHVIKQIKKLKETINFGIVIGGGNILRGDQQGKAIGLRPAVGHQVGMLATIINGVIIKDLLEQQSIPTTLLSAIVCPQICNPISQENIDHALAHNKIIVFSGGTGAPFFTTDTNAVVRALQIGAQEVWKATGVNGVYSKDPAKNPDAQLLKKIKYSDAISQKPGILDTTALTLAEKHAITMRVFNVFDKDSLIKAAKDKTFGSLIR